MARRKALRYWGYGFLLMIVLILVAIVVTAVFIAQDPEAAANGVNGFADALDDSAKAVLQAPISFFAALRTFVERVFN